MKRAGKCVGKKSFGYRFEAEQQVIKNYINGYKCFGVYECPTCLDFHTTSKYDNRTRKLKRSCLNSLLGVKLPHPRRLVELNYQAMNKHLKASRYKVLPLAEQQQAIKSLHA